ncbi:MAG: hypothetical protein ACI9S8_001495 [Chlamydiales bacterium]|jgi:hypothetical protein
MTLPLSSAFQITALMTGKYGVNPPRSFYYGHIFSESKKEVSLSITHQDFSIGKVQTVFLNSLCLISAGSKNFQISMDRNKKGREESDHFVLIQTPVNPLGKNSYVVKRGSIDYRKSPRVDLSPEGFSVTYQKLDESTLTFFERFQIKVRKLLNIS